MRRERLSSAASCAILSVLPFVFAKADQPFRKSVLPLLPGMAPTSIWRISDAEMKLIMENAVNCVYRRLRLKTRPGALQP
jgi:hypothetical protein